VQTAEIICGQGKKINQVDDLREISLGELEGLKKDYVQEHYPSALHAFWQKPSDFAVDGSETFVELRERVVSAVAEIINQSDDQSVLIVSHAAAIKALLSYYQEKDIDQIWDPPELNNGAHIIMASTDHGVFDIALCDNEHDA
jgi:probable phosphoglycerate mutase